MFPLHTNSYGSECDSVELLRTYVFWRLNQNSSAPAFCSWLRGGMMGISTSQWAYWKLASSRHKASAVLVLVHFWASLTSDNFVILGIFFISCTDDLYPVRHIKEPVWYRYTMMKHCCNTATSGACHYEIRGTWRYRRALSAMLYSCNTAACMWPLFNPVLHQIVNIVLPDTPLRYCITLYSGAGFCEEIAPR